MYDDPFAGMSLYEGPVRPLRRRPMMQPLMGSYADIAQPQKGDPSGVIVDPVRPSYAPPAYAPPRPARPAAAPANSYARALRY